MSKDIRSFFSVISKKTGNNNSKSSEIRSKKKPQPIIDSDEDVVEDTPQKSQTSSNKRRLQVISSDSEDDSKSKKKAAPTISKNKEIVPKLKPVNIDDVFGNTPIKQSKVASPPESRTEKIKDDTNVHKKRKKQKLKTEIGMHGDDNFEKTLLELDNDFLLENVDVLDKTIEEALHNEKKDHGKMNLEETQSGSKDDLHKSDKKRHRKDSSQGKESKKPKLDHTDSGIDPDQEAFEKKRYSAMLYQKYKNRGGPKHHGEKELPQGKPDCLKNLTFLRTGVLDSLEGNEFENLVKEHGGRVVHAVSKKVHYLVVGDDAGPAKLDKARGLNIPEISENDLLDMILVKSGMKPKFSKNKSEVSCESGFATEEETSPKVKRQKSPVSDRNHDRVKEEKHDRVKEGKHDRAKGENHERVKEEKHGKVKEGKHDRAKEENHERVKEEKHKEKTSNARLSKTDSSATKIQHNGNGGPKTEKLKNKEQPASREIVKSKDLPQIERPKLQMSGDTMCWTEKYKPNDIRNIIGQQGDKSNMHKLKKWLESWYRNQLPEVHKKLPKPSPWAKNDDGAYYKAALLSGPPGVGKTTTATLVAKELGFDVVEFNASDTRSKRLLHEEVSQLLSTNTIAGFAHGKKKTDKKRVLLMDEVDGMAGNEDRGGMQELISLIKNSSIPIICMCNDRNHQKIRSLVNYCFDLRFQKPRMEQIRGAMMSICFKEDVKISPNALTEIINGTGCDIRQTLNHLSMWSAANKNVSVETAEKESKSSRKDTVLGPWEVVKLVFTESEQKDMSLADKSRLFFYDYSLGPLFVQENYLNVTPNCSRKEVMKRVALAADSISMGDLIDSKIRGSNNWSLLESQAMYSTVLPGHYMSGVISHRINFPGWLGKNSTGNKRKRMLSELCTHTRTSTSGSKLAMKLDYMVYLRNAIIHPLRKFGTDGVHQAIEVMKSYNLLREDLNNLLELCQWKDTKNPFNDIEAKVKSAFTRAYNKEVGLLPFAVGGASKKKAIAAESDELGGEEYAESDTEETDDISADASIKVKSKTKKDETKASTSKAKSSSKSTKGKGKKTK